MRILSNITEGYKHDALNANIQEKTTVSIVFIEDEDGIEFSLCANGCKVAVPFEAVKELIDKVNQKPKDLEENELFGNSEQAETVSCKYCVEDLNNLNMDEINLGFVDGCYTVIEKSKILFIVKYKDEDFARCISDFDIDYCPKCGRYLKESVE